VERKGVAEWAVEEMAAAEAEEAEGFGGGGSE
jgi:hypothetical protein